MDYFIFDEADEILRQQVKDFVSREIKPRAKELAAANRIPQDLIKKLGQMGYLGLAIPEKYGGQPVDNPFTSVGIIGEEIARQCVLLGQLPAGNIQWARSLSLCSEEVQQEWLPALCRGEKLGAVALTEPGVGSDATGLKTSAVRDGDYYIVNGEKTSITSGMNVDMCMAWVRTDPKSKGANGVSTLLIPLDLSGVERVKYDDMGFRLAARASYFFDNVRVPAKYLVGKEGAGFANAMQAMNMFRTIICITLVGGCMQALEDAIEYSKQRVAFGRQIAKFSVVSHRLMDSIAKMEGVRLLSYKSLWTLDHGGVGTKEAAMAKALGPMLALEAFTNAYLTYGHVGYSSEYNIGEMIKDAYGELYADGTVDIQRDTLVRVFMGKEYLSYT